METPPILLAIGAVFTLTIGVAVLASGGFLLMGWLKPEKQAIPGTILLSNIPDALTSPDYFLKPECTMHWIDRRVYGYFRVKNSSPNNHVPEGGSYGEPLWKNESEWQKKYSNIKDIWNNPQASWAKRSYSQESLQDTWPQDCLDALLKQIGPGGAVPVQGLQVKITDYVDEESCRRHLSSRADISGQCTSIKSITNQIEQSGDYESVQIGNYQAYYVAQSNLTIPINNRIVVEIDGYGDYDKKTLLAFASQMDLDKLNSLVNCQDENCVRNQSVNPAPPKLLTPTPNQCNSGQQRPECNPSLHLVYLENTTNTSAVELYDGLLETVDVSSMATSQPYHSRFFYETRDYYHDANLSSPESLIRSFAGRHPDSQFMESKSLEGYTVLSIVHSPINESDYYSILARVPPSASVCTPQRLYFALYAINIFSDDNQNIQKGLVNYGIFGCNSDGQTFDYIKTISVNWEKMNDSGYDPLSHFCADPDYLDNPDIRAVCSQPTDPCGYSGYMPPEQRTKCEPNANGCKSDSECGLGEHCENMTGLCLKNDTDQTNPEIQNQTTPNRSILDRIINFIQTLFGETKPNEVNETIYVGIPNDTLCTASWPDKQGSTININEPVRACDLFEVTDPNLVAMAQQAATCYKTSCSGAGCHGSCTRAWNEAWLNGTADTNHFKQFAGLYFIYALGPQAQYMQGYFLPELDCGSDGMGNCTGHENYGTNARQLVCKGSVGTPNGWADDANMTENSCILSDLPAHADLQIIHTGTCVDYSVSLTTLLRMVGYTKDEVYSVTSASQVHEWNMVRFPNSMEWTIVDTTGNNHRPIGDTKHWCPSESEPCPVALETHCDYDLNSCSNDAGTVACPPPMEVIGCTN